MATKANNQVAYISGIDAGEERNKGALGAYRDACFKQDIQPGLAASVCFIAGFKGKDFPENDDRVKFGHYVRCSETSEIMGYFESNTAANVWIRAQKYGLFLNAKRT